MGSNVVDVLNLGTGNRPIDGAVNHDLWKHSDNIDVVHDLNVLPWPWEDCSFDKVVAWSVFEHLDRDLLTVMNECWRILRLGGMLDAKLPWCQDEMSFNDPTHRYTVGRGIFDTFDHSTFKGRNYGFYRDMLGRPLMPWKIEVVKINPLGTAVRGVLWVVKGERT